jgi:HSP20 family protein
MERLRREMNRLFDDVPARTVRYPAPRYPAMNVWTNEDGAVLTAELPGCDPAKLEITVVDNTLTVAGQRAPEQVGEDVTYHRRERSCGSFSRTFQLPFTVEAGAVEATFENGVLNIKLPRAEADKPKKIEISAG